MMPGRVSKDRKTPDDCSCSAGPGVSYVTNSKSLGRKELHHDHTSNVGRDGSKLGAPAAPLPYPAAPFSCPIMTAHITESVPPPGTVLNT